MEWVVTIDAPWWSKAAGEKGDFYLDVLVDLLCPFIGQEEIKLLFSEDLYTLMFSDNTRGHYLNSIFSRVPLLYYESSKDAHLVSLSPDLILGCSNAEQIEVKHQSYHFYTSAIPPHQVYALLPDRNPDSTQHLTISIDKQTKSHTHLLSVFDAKSLTQFLNIQRPRLMQAKHIAQQERNLGKGKIASTFAAWDSRNEAYAVYLLQKAFDLSGASVLPPDDLFIWDSKNECYVRFMHSGNWEYHGYDIVNFNEVPHDIRQRFHHLK